MRRNRANPKKGNEWQDASLFDLGTVARGKSKHRPRNDSSLFGGEYPFIQTSDIKHSNFYVNSYSQTYNEKGLAQSKLWPKGTMCMTIAANIAETAILSFPACFPDSVVGFLPDPHKSEVKFVKYALDQSKRNFQKTAKGTAQDNLSLEKIDSLKIKAPPLAAQKKIASVLSAYDDLIENNEKRIKILEEKAQRLYVEWFVKFKFPPRLRASTSSALRSGQAGHEKIKMVDSGTQYGMIPEGWGVTRIQDLYETSSGGTPSRKNEVEYYSSGSIPWVKTKELNDNYILDTEEKITELGLTKSSAKMFPKNTVLLAMYGATIGKLGILSQSAGTNQACCAFLIKEHLFSGFYIFQFLKNNTSKLTALAFGGAQPNISQSTIKNLSILRPADNVMKAYNGRAEVMFDGILSLQRRIRVLTQIRDLLLPKLVIGDIEA